MAWRKPRRVESLLHEVSRHLVIARQPIEIVEQRCPILGKEALELDLLLSGAHTRLGMPCLGDALTRCLFRARPASESARAFTISILALSRHAVPRIAHADALVSAGR